MVLDEDGNGDAEDFPACCEEVDDLVVGPAVVDGSSVAEQ